jgi:hypothetical protein
MNSEQLRESVNTLRIFVNDVVRWKGHGEISDYFHTEAAVKAVNALIVGKPWAADTDDPARADELEYLRALLVAAEDNRKAERYAAELETAKLEDQLAKARGDAARWEGIAKRFRAAFELVSQASADIMDNTK